MKKIGYILLFALLLIVTVKPWRQKALSLIFTGTYAKNGLSIDDLKSAQNKDLQTFSSKNLKVNIHHISVYSPSADMYKLKDRNKQFFILVTSIENLSDKNLEPDWFMATYFVEDENGNLYHNYLDQMTGYYQENPEEYTEEKKALIDKYYSKNMPAKTAFEKKLFFFPMPENEKAVKIHFDDPITHERNEFSLK